MIVVIRKFICSCNKEEIYKETELNAFIDNDLLIQNSLDESEYILYDAQKCMCGNRMMLAGMWKK